jgi:hypothetical protein
MRPVSRRDPRAEMRPRSPLAPAIVVRHGPGTARGRRAAVGHVVVAVTCLAWFVGGVAVMGTVIAKVLFLLVGP